MKRLRLTSQQLDYNAAFHAPEWLVQFRKVATMTATYAEIDRDALDKLNEQWPLLPPRIALPEKHAAPVPPAKENLPVKPWPRSAFGAAARAFRCIRLPEDRGVGDTIARIVGPIGGDAYKRWFEESFGRPCGCKERQAQLNLEFPYN